MFVLSEKSLWNRFIPWIHGIDDASRVLCPVSFSVLSPGFSECAKS